MGFGIRDSISGLSSRQFNDILHYDMIAIQDKNITAADQAKVNSLMGEQEVKKHLGIHFEQFSLWLELSKLSKQFNSSFLLMNTIFFIR